jgi:hypothetical protein
MKTLSGRPELPPGSSGCLLKVYCHMTTSYKSDVLSPRCALTLTTLFFTPSLKYSKESSTALPIWHPTVPGSMRLSPLAVKGTFANGAADNEQVVSEPVLLQTLLSDF